MKAYNTRLAFLFLRMACYSSDAVSNVGICTLEATTSTSSHKIKVT